MDDSAPNINRLWADLLVEELIRCGVRTFCVSPGSRSTPLVTAVAAHPDATVLRHFDERASAFAALGSARVSGLPAVWITTSGTAVANGVPAAVEAAMDGVPLILLTADRPPELRDTAANQTIRQPGLFDPYVRWSVDLPPPDPAIDPAFLLTTIDQAVFRSLYPSRGPVHVNAMFREPLAPDVAAGGPARLPRHLGVWNRSKDPYTTYEGAVGVSSRPEPRRAARAIRAGAKGIVVVGRTSPGAAGAAVVLARHLGWPLLADVQTGLAPGAGSPVVRGHDAAIAAGLAPVAPEVIIQVGHPPVSKRLLHFIRDANPKDWIVCAETADRIDPFHRVTHRLVGDPAETLASLTAATAPGTAAAGPATAATGAATATPATAPATPGAATATPATAPATPAPSPGAWCEAWLQTDRGVRAGMSEAMAGDNLSEPGIAWTLAGMIPPEHGVFLGSSMPIRLMDTFGVEFRGKGPVRANRGASGIDGGVATACGMAHALGSPVTALVGDLSVLHDLNALALMQSLRVVLVVINNDGGGIFSFLPIARHQDVFEQDFGTPHGMTFEHAAGQFGLRYAAPGSLGAFRDAYEDACAGEGSAVIELRTRRETLLADHDRVFRHLKSLKRA